MFNRVLIVAPAEGFIIKGLETKLKDLGILSVYAPFKMNEIEGKCDDIDIVFIFTDDSVESYSKVHNLVLTKDEVTTIALSIIRVYDQDVSFIDNGTVC